MVHRNTPCSECRKHRRKCSRDLMNESCTRCKRLNRECTINDTIEASLSNSEIAKAYIQQIDYLNSTLSDLENQFNLLKDHEYSSKDKNDSDNDTIIPYQNNSILTSDWTLRIQHGALRIETGIKNISDLLLHCPPIQYLSPFQTPAEKGLVVQFSPGKSLGLQVLAAKLVLKSLDPRNNNGTHNRPSLSFISLPTSLLFDTRSIIDQLLDIFFQCHSTFHPLIHQPSFMRHYQQLNNPLDSLVCLCICCYVCGSPCNHTLSRFGDLTSIGRYFAGLAKMKIMEQFDLTEKRMENIISINLLVYFLHTLLLNSECKKLLTISYQITIDLLPWYNEECQKQGDRSIEAILYSRNIPSLMIYQRSMGLCMASSWPVFYHASFFTWKALPDEPSELIDYVDTQNLVSKLHSHSVMRKLKATIRDVISGGVCTIPFEIIVRLDEIINEWWKGLPERYRICDDWLDLDQCSKSINELTDGVVLVTFINFLIYMIGIYSQMLQPKSAGNDTILSIVEKLILKRSLYCCRIIMCGFKRANLLDSHSSCRYSLAMKRYLFRIADVLIALSCSSNHIIRNEAKSMFEYCIRIIENIPVMKLHKIDPSVSPLLTSSLVSPKNLGDINSTVYFNYPQPWYAVVYDICRYLEKMYSTTEDPIHFESFSLGFDN